MTHGDPGRYIPPIRTDLVACLLAGLIIASIILTERC